MRKQILLTLATFLLFFGQVLAQRAVSGQVVDDLGNSVPFVSVKEKGKAKGISGDANGNFSIVVAGAETLLEFSAIGYETKTLKVGDNIYLNVVLKKEIKSLETVTITALGFAAKKDKLGTSSSNVKGAAIAQSGETNVLAGMSGKASGVNIVRTTGDPGAGAYVQIRGQSTILNSVQPLVIIDGVPMWNSNFGSGTAGVAQQSRLNDINPNDIASVEILKGTAAAALWGTNAANGVIVITTKKGRTADKVNITYQSTVSVDRINKSVALQQNYGQGTNGLFVYNNVNSWGDKISARPGGADAQMGTAYLLLPDGTRRYQVPNGTVSQPNGGKNSRDVFDHSRELFETGFFFENNLAISGGDERSTFYASIANLAQDGIIKGNSNYDRKTLRLNADRKFGKQFKIAAGLNYSFVESDRVQQGSNLNGIFLGGLRTPPDFNNAIFEGTFVDANGVPFAKRQVAYRNSIGAATNSGYDNPFWVTHRILNKNRVDRMLSNVEMTLNATDWLTFINRSGIDFYNDVRDDYFPFISSGGNNTGAFTLSEIGQRMFNNDFIGRATKDITSNIGATLLVGFNYNSQYTSEVGATIRNFLVPDAPPNFANADASNRTPFNTFTWRRKNALYGQLDVDFYNQLFLSFTGRGERASTFNDMFFFPSTTLAWQFTKLKGLDNSKVLSFGKFRASYGRVGVEPNPFLTNTFFVPASFAEGWGPTINANAPSYGGGYIRSSQFGNPGIKPEIKEEYEIGTDLRFFENRYSLSVTAYTNKTKGAIFNVDVPSSSGFASKWSNAGTIRNKGIEVDFGAEWLRKKDLTITSSLVWSMYRNKVLDMGGTQRIGLAGFTGSSSSAVVGHPLGVIYGPDFARDASGKLLLNANGFPTGLSPLDQVLGDPNPDWNAGLNTSIRFKGFSLNILFDHVQGGDIWNGTVGALNVFGTSAVTGNEVVSSKALVTSTGSIIAAGTPFRGAIHNFGGGDVALTQSWYAGLGGGFSGPATQFIEDGTRTRLREIGLSYSFNSPKIFNVRFKSIDLTATGRNLALWTDYTGVDPETNLTGPSNGRGLDYFNNPSTKSFLLSLKINY